MRRLAVVSLFWIGFVSLWMLFISLPVVTAEDDGSLQQTIPPLNPFDKTVRSASGRIGKAYSSEIVTYTITLNNTTEVSYTARIGLTDTVPFSLTVLTDSIFPSSGHADLITMTNQITWTIDVEYGKQYSLTYAAHTPAVSTTLPLTNVAVLYEIDNVWTPTPTLATTTTQVVLFVEPPPTVYMPIINRAKEQLLQLPNFNFEDTQTIGWSQTPGSLIFNRKDQYPYPRHPDHVAWLGGVPSETNELSQSISLPKEYGTLGVTYLYMIDSGESGVGNDKAEVRITDLNGQALTVSHDLTRSNSKGWQRGVIDISGFKGKSTTIAFWTELNGSVNSNFFVDKVEICSNDDVRNPPVTRRCVDTAIP